MFDLLWGAASFRARLIVLGLKLFFAWLKVKFLCGVENAADELGSIEWARVSVFELLTE